MSPRRGRRRPAQDLAERNAVLKLKATLLFIERLGEQWCSDHPRMVEEGKAQFRRLHEPFDEWLSSIEHVNKRQRGIPYDPVAFLKMMLLLARDADDVEAAAYLGWDDFDRPMSIPEAAAYVVATDYDRIRRETGLNGTRESIAQWLERAFKEYAKWLKRQYKLTKKPLTAAERQHRQRQRRRRPRIEVLVKHSAEDSVNCAKLMIAQIEEITTLEDVAKHAMQNKEMYYRCLPEHQARISDALLARKHALSVNVVTVTQR